METKARGESAKSADEMGQFELVISSEQMKRLSMFTEKERSMFWFLIYRHTGDREWKKFADVCSLAWDVLAHSAKRQKELASKSPKRQ